MKRDIESRQDIEQLVNSFYDKVKKDDIIGFIFNDVARVNWENHLPIMYSFWENIIFYTGGYNGNPITVHQHLNKLMPLTGEHFKRWLKLFTGAVDELFEGEKAFIAKQRATSIATMMEIKIKSASDKNNSVKQ